MNTAQKIEEGSQQLDVHVSHDFSTSLLQNNTLEISNCASTQIQGSLCLLLSRQVHVCDEV